jgi:hypothetical protein
MPVYDNMEAGVRAQEGPTVPVVATYGIPRLLRRRQLPHRRRTAVLIGARRPTRRDLAAGHPGVPVLHVGGHQEARQGLGDVEHQLGSRNLRHGLKLCARSWKSVGACGERLAGAVLQARGFPVKTCKIVQPFRIPYATPYRSTSIPFFPRNVLCRMTGS